MIKRIKFHFIVKPVLASTFAFAAIFLTAYNANSLDLQTESFEVADGDTIVVGSEGANLSYDVTEIRAEAGSTLTIQYVNRGDLPHNVVLVKQRSDINPVGVAALQASQTDYIPQDEANQQRIIAHTILAKPGETVFLTFTVPPPGTYPYICTYAGHFTMMQGDLISE
jgi:azurin